MARANALTLADWVIPQWSDSRDRVTAVTIGLARGGDTNRPGGAFGQGGPAGDGPGQAAAARAVWAQRGWAAFPERSSGAAALYWPVAAAAVAERAVQTVASAPATVAQTAATVEQSAAGLVGAAADTFAIAHWLTTPNAWIRITKVIAGVGLVFIGAAMISFNSIGTPFTRLIGRADEAVARQSVLSGS